MAIAIKLRCSECETVREVELKPEEKEIACVVCGRRMANLPEEDQVQMEHAQKSQRMLSIVAVALFVIAIICVCVWAGGSPWISGKVSGAEGKLVDAQGAIDPGMGPLIGAIVCGVGALVVGIMASLKRFVVEF